MPVLASSPAGSVGRIAGVVLCVVGVGLLAVGFGLWYGVGRLRRRGVRAQGTIVDFQTRPGMTRTMSPAPSADLIPPPTSTSGPVYYPVVEFATAAGETVRATSHVGSNPRPGRVGDAVVVHYDPQDPEHVLVDTGRSRAMTGCGEVVFVTLGGILLVAGVALLTSVH